MTNFLTQEVKKQIIEQFAHHDTDDMHQYAGAQAMLREFDKVVNLDEVIKFLKYDLKSYISVSESIIKRRDLFKDEKSIDMRIVGGVGWRENLRIGNLSTQLSQAMIKNGIIELT